MEPRVATLVLIAGATACAPELGTEGSEACELAAEQLEACFGAGSADAFARTCEPADAARVDGRDCMELTQVLLDEKADAVFDHAVLEAVRAALREALVTGFAAALDQVLQRLGGVSSNDYGAYLLLDHMASRSEADAAVRTWQQELAGRPGFEPTIVEYSTGYGVAHAPCVMSLDDLLPTFLADLIMNQPDNIEVLGGTIERTAVSESRATVDVHLPVVLLPQARRSQIHPDCQFGQ